MNYQALARKWRPQNFANVVGQKHILTALINGLTLRNIHHAYLFSGTHGIGKTSIARLFAKGLNCKNGITSTPCNQCNNCEEIKQGRFVDFIEIDAASRTKVEDTRDLLDGLQYAPSYGRFKVYLIDEVHMLSRHSFNALLKTLEEPPSHVKFLLVTTDPQKLPVTVLSRCLKFHLKSLSIDQIQQQLQCILQQEKIKFETRALYCLAHAANGSMRDALSLTEQALLIGQGSIIYETVMKMLGQLDDEQPLMLIKALVEGKGEEVMALINQLASNGVEWEELLVEMLHLLHRIAILQLLPSTLNNLDSNYAQRLDDLSRMLSPADVQLYYQMLLMGRKDLSLAPTKQLGVEMTLLRAIAFQPQIIANKTIMHSNLSPQVAQKETPPLSSTLSTIPRDNNLNISNTLAESFSSTTCELLQARTQLLNQEKVKTDKSTPIDSRSTLNITSVQVASCNKKLKDYRFKSKEPKINNHNQINIDISYENSPDFMQLLKEVQQRDSWTAEISVLNLPKSVQLLALNTWKESNEKEVKLYLQSKHRYLNSPLAYQTLQSVLSQKAGRPIKLSIIEIEDDNSKVLTPLEWCQYLYKEKLDQAHHSIKSDSYIQELRQVFNADLDEDSIQPM